MVEERTILRVEGAISALDNGQIGIEGSNDADLGFKMPGGKDHGGNELKFLCKDKKGRLTDLEATGTITQAGSAVIIDGDFTAAEGFMRKVSAGVYEAIKSNLTATVAPTTTDDSAAGYVVGSIWIDVTADKYHMCVDSTATAAVWVRALTASEAAYIAVAATASQSLRLYAQTTTSTATSASDILALTLGGVDYPSLAAAAGKLWTATLSAYTANSSNVWCIQRWSGQVGFTIGQSGSSDSDSFGFMIPAYSELDSNITLTAPAFVVSKASNNIQITVEHVSTGAVDADILWIMELVELSEPMIFGS